MLISQVQATDVELQGFSYGLLDTLNKHFQNTLGITRARSSGLQAAYFGYAAKVSQYSVNSAHSLPPVPILLLHLVMPTGFSDTTGTSLFSYGVFVFTALEHSSPGHVSFIAPSGVSARLSSSSGMVWALSKPPQIPT